MSATQTTQSKNKLYLEKSPYLLQHKDNPVWWQAWRPEVLKKAREENKLIFLSIGYSTCHWCHVMEHESFESTEVADLLNKDFIAIKVDREERPDIDKIYMDAIHAMGFRGGWPLNFFLTPELHPIWGGTYFPRERMKSVLHQLQKTWQESPNELRAQGHQLLRAMQQQDEMVNKLNAEQGQKSVHDNEIIEDALHNLKTHFEPRSGGFSNVPKFPTTMPLNLLMEMGAKEEEKHMLSHTLNSMAMGGLYDQVGGGFHRYSTDANWHVPHFEKMLYDNALLAATYTKAFACTSDVAYKQVAQDTLLFIERELKCPSGGYYAALDADSIDSDSHQKKEGAFYIFSLQELKKILSDEQVVWLEKKAKILQWGPFEDKNIINFSSLTVEDWKKEVLANQEWAQIRAKLLQFRDSKRERPHRDEKILTNWNGMMLSALAKAGRTFNDSRFTKLAEDLFHFIRTQLDKDGNLSHTSFGGRALLDDFAHIIEGTLELYCHTGKEELLAYAEDLMVRQEKLFSDEKVSGAYFYAQAGDDLIKRSLDFFDSAEPNAQSITLKNLLLLSKKTINSKMNYQERADKLLASMRPTLIEFPMGNLSGISALLSKNSSSNDEEGSCCSPRGCCC